MLESFYMTFALKEIPVSLREQMVRHRVGMKFGDNYAVDLIPDLPSSTWWSQTMRVRDMSKFYDGKKFHVPTSIKNNPKAHAQFDVLMSTIQYHYKGLIAMGIQPEDAREVLPMAMTHDITWTMNIASIKHVLSKRSCWIAQMGIWEPIILGMVEELTGKVHPAFRTFVDPPCIKNDKYSICPFAIENQNRIKGTDPYQPCPLYLHNEVTYAPCIGTNDRTKLYSALWNRDILTGASLK
jgi:thymidylate synthase ThyX